MSNQTLETRQEVISIPLSQIRPNAKNPRRIIHPETVERLAASMKAGGQETPIKVRRLGEGEYELIGGHRRLMAAQSLGWESLKAMVLEIAPGRVRRAAYLDNESEDMHWLDKYQEIEGFWNEGQVSTPKLTQQALADELGVSQAKIYGVLKVIKVLNAPARESIYHTVVNPIAGFEVTERPVLLLAGLDNPEQVEKALRALIQHKLTLSQVPKLVEWVKAGYPPETYGPQAKVRKPKASGTKAESNPTLEKGGRGDLCETSSPTVKPTEESRASKTETSPHTPKPSVEGQAKAPDTFQNLFFKEAAGISLVSQIKAKLKKGEKPTFGEALVLVTHAIAQVALWAWKHLLKPVLRVLWSVAKKVLHEAVRLVHGLVKSLGRGAMAILKAVFSIVGMVLLIAGLVWVVIEVIKHGFHLAPIARDFMDLVWKWTRFLWGRI